MRILKSDVNEKIICDTPHSVIREIHFFIPTQRVQNNNGLWEDKCSNEIVCQMTTEKRAVWSAVEFDPYLITKSDVSDIKRELYNKCVGSVAEDYRSYDLIKRLAQVSF